MFSVVPAGTDRAEVIDILPVGRNCCHRNSTMSHGNQLLGDPVPTIMLSFRATRCKQLAAVEIQENLPDTPLARPK